MANLSQTLDFGRDGRFDCDMASERLLAVHHPPAMLADVHAVTAAALESPLEFPALSLALVPGDRVVIVLDRQTPDAAELIVALWDVLEAREVPPQNVLILQPADFRDAAPRDPREQLPQPVREAVGWTVHDPTDAAACTYLASLAGGERIYLSRLLLDADFVIPVGSIAYDTLLGYRGTASAIYPGLSTIDALRKAHGQGHVELGPDDLRPLRQVMDEISWLLGIQYALQVVPAGHGRASAVIAGQPDAVFTRGKERLTQEWRVDVDDRPELVLAAVEADAGGHGWPQLAAALDSARRIVAKDGRIVLLTELSAPPTPGIDSISRSETPRDALKPLRQIAPPDLIPATQLARTLDWANVYLHSRLDDDLVEDLFMVPLRDLDEVRRAIAGDEPCVILASAQHTYAQVLRDRAEIR